MKSKFSYKFSPKAYRDLENILSYIEEELCNAKASKDLAEEVFSTLESVIAFPDAGLPIQNEYVKDQSLKRVLIKNYTLIYKVVEEEKLIVVVRFIYSKRDFRNIFK